MMYSTTQKINNTTVCSFNCQHQQRALFCKALDDVILDMTISSGCSKDFVLYSSA